MRDITLRPAQKLDETMIFRWRNTPFIYERGFDGNPVKAKEHREWFCGVLADPNVGMFIIEKKFSPVGQIRYLYTAQKNRATISIYLPKQFTGKGYGPQAIKMCCWIIAQRHPTAIIDACFLPTNMASKKAFRKAGFRAYTKDIMRLKK